MPVTTQHNRLVSYAVAGLGLATLTLLGLHRYLLDASLWIDEATVASNLQHLPIRDYFGPLGSDQTFPRLYLLCIKALTAVFGFHTIVMRALPTLFFVLASAAWMRVLAIRFRGAPAVVFVAVSLVIIPDAWLVQSAMLKQYTLDTLLAILVLSLPDDWLESLFERGERPWRAALLMLPWAFSYTYVIAIAGRLAGYGLWRLRRGGLRLDPRALLGMLLCAAGVGGLLYLGEIRHAPMGNLTHHWAPCILRESPERTSRIFEKLMFGWYGDPRRVGRAGLTHWPYLWLQVLGAIGMLRVALTLRSSERDPEDVWGSRSVAALATIVVFVVASIPLSYPLCAGRLALFILLPLQLMILEGLAAFGEAAAPWRRAALLGTLIAVITGLLLVPAAYTRALRHIEEQPPLNLRPALAEIRSADQLPIVADGYAERLLAAHPDDARGLAVSLARPNQRPAIEPPLQPGDAWVLSLITPGQRRCPKHLLRTYETSNWKPIPLPTTDIGLCRVTVGAPK